MDNVLKAIVEPRRRAILALIQDGELTAGAIAAQFDISRPAISQHLQVLVEANLVTVRREGTKRLYSLRRDGLSELRVFVESFWDERLNTLKAMAEAEEAASAQAETHEADRSGPDH
jgi:DNA-binding transcriptional ArsR family regulator